jgi:hypothetical protein
VCVDIVVFDQRVVCRYVVSRSSAFTLIAVRRQVADVLWFCVLFALLILLKPRRCSLFFFTLPCGVAVRVSGSEGREVFSRWFGVVIFK